MTEANKIEYWSGVGDAKQVLKAIDKGYDVNQPSEGGYTALHAAAENNHVEVIRLLVSNGADINAKVVTGMTPLDMAREAECHEAANLLMELGAMPA